MKLLWQQKLCNLQQLKNRSFHVPQPTFLFLLETPLRLSRNICCMDGRQFNACQTPRSMYLSVFNSFRVIRCLSQCVTPKIAIFLPHFGFPCGCPWGNHAKCCMYGKRIRCLQIVSQHPSIFNNFPVIRTASAKNRRFHVPQPTFLSPLETPLRLSRNMLHGWKDNSMLAKPLAACTYLSSIVSELYDA